jgi:dTMP kinase
VPPLALFITLEGTEGSGKSTQAAQLADALRDCGWTVALTREPGGSPETLSIRQLLADPDSKLEFKAELLLFLADRAQHVVGLIRPALARGEIVICDRYSDSTLAYQGYGRGHDPAKLQELNDWAADGLVPDLTFWIDSDVTTSLRRARGAEGLLGDRFEAEPIEFHSRIHRGFEALAAAAPQRFVRINGDRPVETITPELTAEVHRRLAGKTPR